MMIRNLRTMGGAAMLAVVMTTGVGCAGTETREEAVRIADDSAVTARVKTALAQDDASSLLDVEVETFDGITQLSGFVDDEATKMRAGEITEDVEGVRRVENSLVIKPAT